MHREVTVNLARLLAAENEPAKRTMIERQLQRAKGNAERAGPYVRWLLALAHVWQIGQALERSRWFTLAGGVLVIAGSVLFFTATSGPTYVPALIPQVTAAPSTTAPPTAVIPHRSPVPSVTP